MTFDARVDGVYGLSDHPLDGEGMVGDSVFILFSQPVMIALALLTSYDMTVTRLRTLRHPFKRPNQKLDDGAELRQTRPTP